MLVNYKNKNKNIISCPECGEEYDEFPFVNKDFKSTNTGRDDPQPGDVTVCWGCGCYLKYTAYKTFVVLSDDEFLELDTLTMCQLAGFVRYRDNYRERSHMETMVPNAIRIPLGLSSFLKDDEK